jgi:class 3 adenylate cyclase
VIDVLSDYNGDVVKFLGDALLVVFEADPKDENPLQAATMRASLCAAE